MIESFDCNRLLNEKEAAAFLKFTTRALQSWRQQGIGPKFVKISSRAVRYRLQDLMDWASSKIVNSTAGQL